MSRAISALSKTLLQTLSTISDLRDKLLPFFCLMPHHLLPGETQKFLCPQVPGMQCAHKA